MTTLTLRVCMVFIALRDVGLINSTNLLPIMSQKGYNTTGIARALAPGYALHPGKGALSVL